MSHHVRQKVMGVSSEHAGKRHGHHSGSRRQKLVDAKTDDQKQAAILEAQVFPERAALFAVVAGRRSPGGVEGKYTRLPAEKKQSVRSVAATTTGHPAAPNSPSRANLMKTSPTPMRILTPEALAKLQHQNEDAIDRMTKGLDKEAHFVAYAAPSFIGFRQGAYLQLSILPGWTLPPELRVTSWRRWPSTITFLIWCGPCSTYFPPEQDFDGIDFSSMIHVADGIQSVGG